MHDVSIHSDEFRAGLTFDPVCGAVLRDEATNQFFDGERTHYFCCAMCRRIFIDESRAAARVSAPASGLAGPEPGSES